MSVYAIEAMTPADLPAVVRMQNEAFRLMLIHQLGAIPPGVRPEGDRIANRLAHPGTTGFVVRDERGAIHGSCFYQRFGSRGMAGPIAIASTLRDRGAASGMVGRLIREGERLGCAVTESCTFAASPHHMRFYFSRGITAGLPLPVLARPLAMPSAPGPSVCDVVRYSAVSEDKRAALLEGAAAVTGTFAHGYDASAEIAHVARLGIGESVLAVRDGRVEGFAVGHFGDGSETFGEGEVSVKMAFVRRGEPDAQRIFTDLIVTLEQVGREAGQGSIATMVSAGRRVAVETLFERGYDIRAIMTEWTRQHHPPEGPSASGAVAAFHEESDCALLDLR